MAERASWSGLQARELEDQERAALAIYDSVGSDAVVPEEQAPALRASVQRGNHSAAAILLLGHDASPEAKRLLRRLRDQPAGENTKLRPWLPLVPIALPANLALSRGGDPDARARLLAHLAEAPVGEVAFVLDVAREVDDPTVLHALGKALDDERPVAGGVPSGAQPQRRLADLAVDALSDRLNLSVSFPRKRSGRYSREEIQEVKRLLRTTLPQ